MRTFSPNFVLREAREYVHGTDMYSVITDRLKELWPDREIGAFSMNIRRTTPNNLLLQVSDANEPIERPARGVTDFSCSTPAGRVSGWLVETDVVVVDSAPFAEQEIIRNASMSEKGITLPAGFAGFAPIQCVVALCKALHYKHRPPGDLVWMFSRLSLNRLLPDDLSKGSRWNWAPAIP